MQLCDFAVKGRLPVDGGVLSQTQGFLDALAFYEAEVVGLKAKRDPLELEDR